MTAHPQAYAANGDKHPLLWPFCISFGAHLLLLAYVLFSPGWRNEPSDYLSSVINVQMVDLSQISSAPATKSETAVERAPAEATPEQEEEPVPAAQPETTAEPEVSVAPTRKETKSALKYKTFKPTKVVKNTLQRVEKKVDTQPPKPLEDTLKRLREKVAREGEPGGEGAQVPGAQETGKGVGFGQGSQKEIEQIDLYRLDIAYTVNKNWAFAEQLSGGGKQLVASIAFKVMKDGTISDIFFTDRSGNPYLDESGYKAIVKSSPVKPHPEGLNRPYVEMGLRFGPEGVR